jgi:hypothetical protein
MSRRILLVLLLAGWALVWSGAYVFVYLYRWEWNRAIVSGIVFVASEVALLGWLLNGKLNRIERRDDAERARRIRARMMEARAERSHVFDWLDPRRQQASVFLPILMGTGLVLSGLAWAVEKLAKATAGRATDASIASSLSRMLPPANGFLDDSGDPLRDLRGPAGRRC